MMKRGNFCITVVHQKQGNGSYCWCWPSKSYIVGIVQFLTYLLPYVHFGHVGALSKYCCTSTHLITHLLSYLGKQRKKPLLFFSITFAQLLVDMVGIKLSFFSLSGAKASLCLKVSLRKLKTFFAFWILEADPGNAAQEYLTHKACGNCFQECFLPGDGIEQIDICADECECGRKRSIKSYSDSAYMADPAECGESECFQNCHEEGDSDEQIRICSHECQCTF